MNLTDFKAHFHRGDLTHFNNSGQALIPDVNRDSVIHWMQRFYREAAFCSVEGWAQTEVTRKKLATFIGADPHEVSFFQTTASALSQVASAIPLEKGDEILTWDQEYPTNFYPWRKAAERSSAELIQIKSDNWSTPAEKILNRVTEKTRVIAISWVQFQTGAVTDLKKISQALKGKNIWLVADVIQGAGVRPLHFHDTGFDALCGGSHKWMCSSYGAGFMALKKERMAQVAPLEVGAMTYGTPDTPKTFANPPKSDASRYEPGSKSMAEIIALGATLDLFSQIGIETIFAEASRICKLLANGLNEIGFKTIENGPILNFYPAQAGELAEVIHKLKAGKVSFAPRGPGIRLSAHAYNTEADVEKVLSLLK